MKRFTDKTVIVTGGAKGIGRACCDVFLAEGANVVMADIDDEAGMHTNGDPLLYTHCDVSDKKQVSRVVAQTLETFGRIDVLINNAGIAFSKDFLELEEEDFTRVLNINLKGMFLMGQLVAKAMVEQNIQGSIVNMASINAQLAIPTQTPYCASKGGALQLTRVMALALAPYHIRVNAIGPGSIQTEMLGSVNQDPAALNKILSRTPLQRIGEAREIATIAAFLASDDASYITGQIIYADGGRLALNYTV